MALYEVPTSPAPQTFLTTMANKNYRMRILYREVDAGLGGWVLDIADDDGGDLVHGIPLVTGENLLSPYAYLGFEGALFVYTDGAPDAVPSFSGLGSLTKLYFFTADA